MRSVATQPAPYIGQGAFGGGGTGGIGTVVATGGIVATYARAIARAQDSRLTRQAALVAEMAAQAQPVFGVVDRYRDMFDPAIRVRESFAFIRDDMTVRQSFVADALDASRDAVDRTWSARFFGDVPVWDRTLRRDLKDARRQLRAAQTGLHGSLSASTVVQVRRQQQAVSKAIAWYDEARALDAEAKRVLQQARAARRAATPSWFLAHQVNTRNHHDLLQARAALDGVMRSAQLGPSMSWELQREHTQVVHALRTPAATALLGPVAAIGAAASAYATSARALYDQRPAAALETYADVGVGRGLVAGLAGSPVATGARPVPSVVASLDGMPKSSTVAVTAPTLTPSRNAGKLASMLSDRGYTVHETETGLLAAVVRTTDQAVAWTWDNATWWTVRAWVELRGQLTPQERARFRRRGMKVARDAVIFVIAGARSTEAMLVCLLIYLRSEAWLLDQEMRELCLEHGRHDLLPD